MLTRSILIALLITMHASIANTHPAWALVTDDEGNIYVSDLLTSRGKVIKFLPDGSSKVILEDIHSHDLYMDEDGYLWGTNTRYYQGQDRYTNSLWKWKDGKLSWVIEEFEDFSKLNGSNFMMDETGGIYYDYEGQIYYRTPTNEISKVSDFQFGRICTLGKDCNGDLLVNDSSADGCLYRIDRQGDVSLIASGLLEEDPPDPPLKERRFNMFYGMQCDETGIYITNSGSRRVWKITNGEKTIFYDSTSPYYPINLKIEDDRILLLEASFDETGNGGRLITLDKQLQVDKVMMEWHTN